MQHLWKLVNCAAVVTHQPTHVSWSPFRNCMMPACQLPEGH